MNAVEENQKKKLSGPKVKYIIGIAIMLAVVIIVLLAVSMSSKKSEPEIISKSTLEDIINVSDLSTFEAVYNGIAKVTDEDNPEKVNYYVSYDAKVKAGIDFEKVDITVNTDEKIITVMLPEIKITDVNVDITSLDYIFENEKANTETVSEEAYKKCIEDVTSESNSEDAIYELAEQNARNIVEALISPFVEQLDSEYRLEIQ
ncbi:DUF4230 domain-containing protein [Enterocloster sp.]|jgi:hypothetical protein|uniref:DUF4230 domain-containing protein n=1 Tax=Enterocloster sp. TaxID=2719315 RepID=UPI003AB1AC2D